MFNYCLDLWLCFYISDVWGFYSHLGLRLLELKKTWSIPSSGCYRNSRAYSGAQAQHHLLEFLSASEGHPRPCSKPVWNIDEGLDSEMKRVPPTKPRALLRDSRNDPCKLWSLTSASTEGLLWLTLASTALSARGEESAPRIWFFLLQCIQFINI